MTQEVEVAYLEPKRMLTPGDLIELGETLKGQGILQGRALVAKLQEAATQIVLAAVPPIMEEVRKVHDARLREIESAVMLMPQTVMGNVNRDTVLRLIRTVMNTDPRI